MSRCARGVVRPAGHTRPFSSAADICVYMQCGDRPTDRPTNRSPDMSFCANDESTVCEFIKWIARVCLSYVAAAGACRFVAVSTSIDALRCTSGLCNSKAIWLCNRDVRVWSPFSSRGGRQRRLTLNPSLFRTSSDLSCYICRWWRQTGDLDFCFVHISGFSICIVYKKKVLILFIQ